MVAIFGKKKGLIAVCPDCEETYQVSQRPQCLACQGRMHYTERDPLEL